MVTSQVYCDKCKDQILEARSQITVTCGPLRTRFEVIDLCPACASQFASSMGKPPEDAIVHLHSDERAVSP